MRVGIACIAAWLAIQEAASARYIGNVGEDPHGRFPEGEYFGRGRAFRLSPKLPPLPFDLVFDVNGVERRIEKEARARLAVNLETEEASFIWVERGVEELIGFSGGSRFKIVSYPIKRLQSRNELNGDFFGRIYTQVFRWVGDGVGENFGFEPYINSLRGNSRYDTDDASMEWTQPLIIQSMEQIDERRWMLRGVSGPRWTGDVTLFDEVVGGEQFTVRLKEFGFGDLGDVLAGFANVPEPPTWIIAAAACLPLLVWRSRRRPGRVASCGCQNASD